MSSSRDHCSCYGRTGTVCDLSRAWLTLSTCPATNRHRGEACTTSHCSIWSSSASAAAASAASPFWVGHQTSIFRESDRGWRSSVHRRVVLEGHVIRWLRTTLAPRWRRPRDLTHLVACEAFVGRQGRQSSFRFKFGAERRHAAFPFHGQGRGRALLARHHCVGDQRRTASVTICTDLLSRRAWSDGDAVKASPCRQICGDCRMEGRQHAVKFDVRAVDLRPR